MDRGRRRRRRGHCTIGRNHEPTRLEFHRGRRPHTDRDNGLSLGAVCALEPYWEALRKVYAPFESGLPAPTGRVYTHEIPGGQLSNLRQQAIALGFGDRFEDIEANYAAADRILGRLVKVTPSSKVVGDLALSLLGARVSADEFASEPTRYYIPDSVIGFLHGELGDPPDGGQSRCAPKRYRDVDLPKPNNSCTPQMRLHWRPRA